MPLSHALGISHPCWFKCACALQVTDCTCQVSSVIEAGDAELVYYTRADSGTHQCIQLALLLISLLALVGGFPQRARALGIIFLQ